MLNKNKRLIPVFLAVLVLVSGCSMPWKREVAPVELVFPTDDLPEKKVEEKTTEPEVIQETGKMKKFSDPNKLAAWLAENSNPEAFLLKDSGAGRVSSDAMSAGSLSSVLGSALDVSGTNNQVAGVDEADIIKSDGSYIYALVKNDLLIIKAFPPDSATVVSKISFDSRPQDIFISGRKIAVFGSDDRVNMMPFYQKIRRYNPYSFFMVFDINDPAKPALVRDLKFEGSYLDARLIGDYVYFITVAPGFYLAGEPLLPRLIDNGAELATDCQAGGKCYQPDVYYFDISYDSYEFAGVSSINIKDETEAVSGHIYLLSGGQEVFVSEKNIYIAHTQTMSEHDLEQASRQELVVPLLGDDEKGRISDIEKSPSYVLNNHEKRSKIAQIIDRYISSLKTDEQRKLFKDIDNNLEKKLIAASSQIEKTVLHKIGANNGRLDYLATGEVPGRLLNQFSLDEFKGNLRIATTRSEQWSRFDSASSPSYSNVYVLDGNLKIIGRLEKLATTERIYSVRFLGDRAYIATFKQTDPLFVISLADPTKPGVLNAIKVPGFSSYLHPADSSGTKLFSLGRHTETGEGGEVKVLGVKLALYDFTDTAKPQELDSFLIGEADSDSIALYDHRAFLYAKEKNILVIPAVLREGGRLAFAGSLVFGVEGDKLSLKSRIDHSAGGYFAQPDYWRGYSYYDNTVKRSLYINDYLYTFSNKFLKANSLGDWSEAGSLQLTSSPDDYIITRMSAEAESAAIISEEAGVSEPMEVGEGALLPEAGAMSGAGMETGDMTEGSSASGEPEAPVLEP